MSLHCGLFKGSVQRLLAATSVVALGVFLGAGPSAADTGSPPAATDTTAVSAPADVAAPTDPTAPADVAAPTDPTAPTTKLKKSAKLSGTTTSLTTTAPLVVTAGAVCPTTAQVAGSSAPGGFEIDGNCQSNGLLDWNSPEVGTQPVANDMLLNVGDTTEFTANAGKTDIQYVYAYAHGDAAALWLDFGFDRFSNTGTVAYQLELNQAPANTGPTNSVPDRTVGDYLFNITQNGNGDFALISVQRWTGTTWSAPTGTTGVVGKADAAGFFFEISLNLTSLTGVTTTCPPSTLFTTVNLRTQVSTSPNSQFADYISGLTIPPPNNCPTLTLNKNVVGGTAAASAWTLTAQTSDNGVPAAFRTVSGTTGVTGAVVPAKAYALSESGPSAYTGSAWTCPGATVSGALGSQTVTVGSADVTCTITNTATSTLTVHKTNPAGDALSGATFVLHSGSAAGTIVGSCTTTLPSGTCSVSGLGFGSYYWVETVAPPGYVLPTGSAAVFGPVTVNANNAGRVIAATVVPDVPETHLTLVKSVSNTWGGTAAASAWTLAASGPTTGVTGTTGAAAVTNVVVSPGNYALSESGGPSGYAGTWACSGANLGAGDTVSLTVGQSATCTVNNADLPAHLTLIKTVVNVFGGTSIDRDWTLTATGPTPAVQGRTGISGKTLETAVTFAPVAAGTYALSESGPGGYDASAWVCPGATFTAPNLVTLALGQATTCTITNSAQPAHLTLQKVVTNSFGGTSVVGDWTLTAAQQSAPPAGVTASTITGKTGVAAVTAAAVNAGTYALSESGPSGYAGTWSCGPFVGFTAPDQLVLGLGQSATCTIINTDKAAHLTLVKEVSNTHGGTSAAEAWTLSAVGPTSFSGVTGTTAVTNKAVSAGSYSLSESGPVGYAASAWSCTGEALTAPGQVTLALDQSVTCTIINTDKAAHLTLVKEVSNTLGGTSAATAWTLSAVGPVTISGTTGTDAVTNAEVSAGTYTLSEANGPAGYSASAWVCTAGTLDGASLTLALGQSATCSITNSFVPAPPVPVLDAPAISLLKLATLNDTNSNGMADAGETIIYSFLVTNTGNVVLTTIAVVDPLLDSAPDSAVTCAPTTLLPGGTATCTAAAYTVSAGDVATGQPIINVATASGQPPTGSRVEATDTVSTPTNQPLVLEVVVTDPVVITAAPAKFPAAVVLAFTGAAIVPLGLSGLLALLLGAGLIATARRQGRRANN